MIRTDISLNYAHRLPGTRRGEIFANFHVLNLFNQFQLFDVSGIGDQHHRAHRGRRRDAVPDVQSVHDDAGSGHALGLRRPVRRGDRG